MFDELLWISQQVASLIGDTILQFWDCELDGRESMNSLTERNADAVVLLNILA